ncbi:hypothetical protein LINPERHAP2_LOCUS30278 [Linum perenne]
MSLKRLCSYGLTGDHVLLQSHPKATGLNNKPLLHWEDLCVIYGVDQAIGADAVQPSDAASRLVGASGAAIFMDEDTVAGGSFDLPPNLTHTEVMEEIINQGDLAVKRQSLYQELAKFGELSSSQRNKVLRHLNRDDGDCTTFFQFPTDEEKLEFVWSIIE